MPLYHLLLDGADFRQRLRPALAAAWRQRSFEPCRAICAALSGAAQTFAKRYQLGPGVPLVCRAAEGLAFDRTFWRHLVGEFLWLVADVPGPVTAPESLCRLAGADLRRGDPGRSEPHPMGQVHYGSRDLTFGTACYRPGEVGCNEEADVARLCGYLAAVEPAAWEPGTLADLPGLESPAERAEEVELARESLRALQEVYGRAQQCRQVVVCERLAPGYCPD